jgi:hypothetical protein
MHRAPAISPVAFLRHAERWDAGASQASESKVIYQKVRIKTPSQMIERSIYRDSAGRRKPKQQPLGSDAQQIRDRLARAGINWDEPLSAASYENWRAREQGNKDTVVRADGGLLTLTTTAPSDPLIKEESFTVREHDFHPISRTVELRDSGNIEIAELNYDVLPWSAINDGLFEPEAPLTGAAVSVHPALPIHIPVPLTETELDLAELSARLALSRLHADNGERIEIVRSEHGVQVKGVVETDERKREIEKQLCLLPHVIPAIFSYSDMVNHASAATTVTSVHMSSVVSETTPLEEYLVNRGWTRDDVRHVSLQIFDSSVTIDRESQAITDLLARFASKNDLGQTADAALQQLIEEHRSRLLTALAVEERSISAAGVISPPMLAPMKSVENLTGDAETNVNLVKELISNTNLQPRLASAIVLELAESVAQLRIDLLHVQQSQLQVSHPSPSLQAPNEKH